MDGGVLASYDLKAENSLDAPSRLTPVDRLIADAAACGVYETGLLERL